MMMPVMTTKMTIQKPMEDQERSIILQLELLNIVIMMLRRVDTKNWMRAATTIGIDMK